MRTKILLVSAMLLCFVAVADTEGNRQVYDPGSGAGKSFLFTARKLGVPILRASIKLAYGLQEEGRPLSRIHAEVRSLNPLGFLFRMNNRFTSVMEADTCSPVRYVKEIDQEGLLIKRKQYHQILTFDPMEKKVVVENGGEREKREIPVPSETYDPLSMFGRCYLKEELHPGQEIRMSIFDGVKLRQMIFHSKKERVKSKHFGEVDAVCLESSTSFSTFGEKEGGIRICYTLDGKKTPISMELSLPVGNVRFDLEDAEEG
jgi:hypothetical protein